MDKRTITKLVFTYIENTNNSIQSYQFPSEVDRIVLDIKNKNSVLVNMNWTKIEPKYKYWIKIFKYSPDWKEYVVIPGEVIPSYGKLIPAENSLIIVCNNITKDLYNAELYLFKIDKEFPDCRHQINEKPFTGVNPIPELKNLIEINI